MMNRKKFPITVVSLCIALTLCLTFGIAFSVLKTDMDSEEKNIAEFEAIEKMPVLPTDFSVVSEAGKEVTIHINPNIREEVDAAMISEMVESSHVNSGDRININHIGYPEQKGDNR